MDRTEKREFVSTLAAVFADTSMVVVTRNNGLTVAEVTVLRQRMRAAGATYKVAKNRLAHLALEGTRFDGIAPLLKGPTALAWAQDPVAVAKVAVEFAKTNEKLVLVGGALGTQTLDADGVRALAELPSLDALRCQAAGPDPGPGDSDRQRGRGAGGPARSCAWRLRPQGRGRGRGRRAGGRGAGRGGLSQRVPGRWPGARHHELRGRGTGLAWNRAEIT